MDKPYNSSRVIRQKAYFAILSLLNSITGSRKYPDILIGELFKKEELSPAEKEAIAGTIYGLLRHRGRIDYVIEQASSAVLSGLDLNVLNVLRICAYQAVFTDTSPAGVVNNAVALTSVYEKGRFTGFIKRTAEAVVRNKNSVIFPDKEKRPVEFIAAYNSHPAWIVEKWQREFGDVREVEALCKANNLESPLTIRVNPLKADRASLQRLLQEEGYSSSLTDFSPYGLAVDVKRDIFKTEAFRNGLFEVQDEGSQLIAMLTGAKPGELIVDACAGNGGKSLFLSGLMEAKGSIVAVDTHAGKLANLRRRAMRGGASNVRTALPGAALQADCVFIDAPCSGMGVFRRNPDSKWRLGPEDISELAAKQKEVLREYSGLVKPGGRLVYATCTVSREENEEVVGAFLEESGDFYLVPAAEVNPDVFGRFTSEDGFFRSMPHIHGTDGFFGAVMRRRASA